MGEEKKTIKKHFLPLEKAWPKGPLEATFLTSYTFHAPFFEAQLLPLLRSRGAHPIIVFLDKNEGYAATIATLSALHGAGRRYYLIPYDPGRFAFHPKVHLFCGSGGACLVGSGNLTPHGCGGNLEAFDILYPDVDGIAVGQIRGFFRILLEKCEEHIPPEDRSWLMSFLDKADDLPAVTGEAVVIQSLEKGIQDQFTDLLLEDSYSELLAAAPFHNKNHAVSDSLAKVMGKPHVRLAANPLEAPNTPTGIKHGRLVDTFNRRLHAKVVHAQGLESSVLVVGSANLTLAAWEPDKNVEACVVRPALDPDEFNDWLAAAYFEETAWEETQSFKSDKVGGLKSLPVRWAKFEGGKLVVSLPDVSGLIRFVIETANDFFGIELKPNGDGLWIGECELEEGQPAVLCIRASGWEMTRVLVIQPRELRMASRADNIRKIFRKAKKESLNWEDRQEVLGCIGDVIAALHSYAVDQHNDRLENPESSDDSKQNNSKDHKIALVQTQTLIKEVESLFPGVLGTKGQHSQGMEQLLRLIDALGKGSASEDPPRRRKHWQFDDLDLTTLPQSEMDGRDINSKDADIQPEDPENLPDPDEVDPCPQEVEGLIKLVEQAKNKTEELLEQETDGPLVINRLIIKAIAVAAARSPITRLKLWESLLDWLEWEWAVADWPSIQEGWALSVDATPRPDSIREEYYLLKTTQWLLKGDYQQTLLKDRAHRILKGLLCQNEGTVIGKDIIKEDVSYGDPEDVLLIKLRRELLNHQTIGEEAKSHIEPLWKLDRAASRFRSINSEQRALVNEIKEKEDFCMARSHRNKNRQKTETELVDLRAHLDVLELRMKEEKARQDDAENLLEERNPDVLNLWKNKVGWKKGKGGEYRVFSLIESGLPGCCHIQLSTTLRQFAMDHRNVLICPHCNVLLAAGSGDIIDD